MSLKHEWRFEYNQVNNLRYMLSHKYRVAIARILSDLIKADNIIEKSEICLYNSLQEQFGINQTDRREALGVTITQAINCIRELDKETKDILQQALLQTAKADNQCVAKEALILLALKYVLEDTDAKYQVLSCDTTGLHIDDKFMIYIESDENIDLNDDIRCDIDALCDRMSLWNFDFVYIPNITSHLLQMESSYIKDVIRYMKPMFDDDVVDSLYEKLTHITTEYFTTELLGAQMNMTQLRECQPSLLINFGTSLVPYCGGNNQGRAYTDFLCIRIDDTVLAEVHKFIADYGRLITHRECVFPQQDGYQFKYFGFYKVLFDFLSVADAKGLVDQKLVIDLRDRCLRIQGQCIKLSPMELTTYILILQQSVRGYGLPHFRTQSQLATRRKLCEELTRRFRTIYLSLGQSNDAWQFEDNTRNIAAYIARIKEKLRKQVMQATEVYLPYQRTIADDMDYYSTNVNTENVYVSVYNRLQDKKEEYKLIEYRPWK